MATFPEYLSEAIGHSNAQTALEALSQSPAVSIRLNPFKADAKFLEKQFGNARRVEWSQYGYMLENRPSFTLDPLFHAGAYYVQDSSAMFVGEVFRSVIRDHDKGIRVLDLCASPGGKTTDIAASLREKFGDDFLLVSNEVMKSRTNMLCNNVSVWGDPCVIVTSADPKVFARLEGYFDVIVADVPCSGEGMFRKDEEALRQWSEDNVRLCESRQKRIVSDVWPALRSGGVLVYSTCTFNRRENDLNAKWIADNLGADFMSTMDCPQGPIKTEYGWSLVPGFVDGEGQYCSALRKHGDDYRSCSVYSARSKSKSVFPKQVYDLMDRPVTLFSKSERIIAVPQTVAGEVDALNEKLRPLHSGTVVGMMKGKDFVPDEELAQSLMLNSSAYPKVNLDIQQALAYLHKDAIVLKDAPPGYLLVCYEGLPLGFVKNLGNRCNNLFPPERRIRMNINYV